jgi:hypothetical protein
MILYPEESFTGENASQEEAHPREFIERTIPEEDIPGEASGKTSCGGRCLWCLVIIMPIAALRLMMHTYNINNIRLMTPD